jgi:hypothetical protein
MATVAALAGPAKAQNGGEGASQDIISRQLEAFLSGDFARAYTFASPDIKRIFPTLERFMSMVQSGYLPVLRPGNYAFGRSEQLPDGRIQWEVLIDGPDGKGYTATYFMEKQEDGSWKVDAVSLRRGAPGMT